MTRAGLIALAFAVVAAPAEACSCFPTSRAEILARADLVFEGEVAVVSRVGRDLQATIDIARQEKGPRMTSVTVLTPDSPAACGVDFRVAQRVLVAVVRDGRVWRTDLCMALALRPVPFIPSR